MVEAIFAYNSKGFDDGQGRVTISGEGGPCKKLDDVSGGMGGDVVINDRNTTSVHYTAEISREIDV